MACLQEGLLSGCPLGMSAGWSHSGWQLLPLLHFKMAQYINFKRKVRSGLVTLCGITQKDFDFSTVQLLAAQEQAWVPLGDSDFAFPGQPAALVKAEAGAPRAAWAACGMAARRVFLWTGLTRCRAESPRRKAKHQRRAGFKLFLWTCGDPLKKTITTQRRRTFLFPTSFYEISPYPVPHLPFLSYFEVSRSATVLSVAAANCGHCS